MMTKMTDDEIASEVVANCVIKWANILIIVIQFHVVQDS